MSAAEALLKDNKPVRYAITAVVVVGGTLLIIWGAKTIFEKLKTSDSNKEVKETDKEVNTNNLYHTEAEFLSIANGIQTALDYSGSIDLNALKAQLVKLKSADEWKKVVVVFGKRKANATLLWLDGNLNDWMNGKLNYFTRPEVEKILDKIGVTL